MHYISTSRDEEGRFVDQLIEADTSDGLDNFHHAVELTEEADGSEYIVTVRKPMLKAYGARNAKCPLSSAPCSGGRYHSIIVRAENAVHARSSVWGSFRMFVTRVTDVATGETLVGRTDD